MSVVRPLADLDGSPRRIGDELWGVALEVRTLPPWGATNCYLVSSGGVAWLVDPGGDGEAAQAAIDRLLGAAGVRTLKGVLLSHSHQDHVAGLLPMMQRHAVDTVLAHPAALPRLPEGLPLRALNPGRTLLAGAAELRSVATPGHASDHLAFWLPGSRTLLAGDLVAGSGSVWVGLPDGSVSDYLDSLAVAAALAPDLVAPAHGPLRGDGTAVFDEARRHRLQREAEVWAALADGPRMLDEIRAALYPDLPEASLRFVRGTVLAHLHKLMRETRVAHLGQDPEGPYARSPGAEPVGADDRR